MIPDRISTGVETRAEVVGQLGLVAGRLCQGGREGGADRSEHVDLTADRGQICSVRGEFGAVAAVVRGQGVQGRCVHGQVSRHVDKTAARPVRFH